MNKTWTIWIIIGVTLGLIIWDIYAAITPEDGDTISRVLLEWSENHIFVPFAFGVLMGHWFWPQKINRMK